MPSPKLITAMNKLDWNIKLKEIENWLETGSCLKFHHIDVSNKKCVDLRLKHLEWIKAIRRVNTILCLWY